MVLITKTTRHTLQALEISSDGWQHHYFVTRQSVRWDFYKHNKICWALNQTWKQLIQSHWPIYHSALEQYCAEQHSSTGRVGTDQLQIV